MTGTAQWATRVLDKLHQPEASPLACTSLVAGSVASSSGLELEAGRANAPEQLNFPCKAQGQLWPELSLGSTHHGCHPSGGTGRDHGLGWAHAKQHHCVHRL